MIARVAAGALWSRREHEFAPVPTSKDEGSNKRKWRRQQRKGPRDKAVSTSPENRARGSFPLLGGRRRSEGEWGTRGGVMLGRGRSMKRREHTELGDWFTRAVGERRDGVRQRRSELPWRVAHRLCSHASAGRETGLTVRARGAVTQPRARGRVKRSETDRWIKIQRSITRK